MYLFLNWELGLSEKISTPATCGYISFSKVLIVYSMTTAIDCLSWLWSSARMTRELQVVLLVTSLAQMATVNNVTCSWLQ